MAAARPRMVTNRYRMATKRPRIAAEPARMATEPARMVTKPTRMAKDPSGIAQEPEKKAGEAEKMVKEQKKVVKERERMQFALLVGHFFYFWSSAGFGRLHFPLTPFIPMPVTPPLTLPDNRPVYGQPAPEMRETMRTMFAAFLLKQPDFAGLNPVLFGGTDFADGMKLAL